MLNIVKKTRIVLRKLVYLTATVVVAVVILAIYKYKTGKQNYWPFPYHFTETTYNAQRKVEAPILIVGDRLGARLGQFKDVLAWKVSEHLSVPIKVETLATKGEGLHRTIQRIEKLEKLPLIIIYLGGSEEYLEKKYDSSDIDPILTNIKTFQDLRVQSLLMLAPWLSRLIFLNMQEVVLDEKPNLVQSKFSDDLILKHNEIDYHMYGFEYSKLVTYAKDRNAFLITITAPINLDIAPKKSCDLTMDKLGQAQLDKVLELIKKQDFKGAYRLSKDLVLMAPSNAKAHYLHGKVSKQLGLIKESIKSLELAASFDCIRWRATPVHNAILKKIARAEDVVLFDFNQMLYDNWTKNVTFQDEIYPQNFFMEQMVTSLAAHIKKLLKL